MFDQWGLEEAVGVAIAFCAAAGLWVTLDTCWHVLKADDREDLDANSRRFFGLFSSISLLYNAVLTGIAVGVFIGRPIPWWLFLIFLLLPWLYVGWLGRLWLNPRFGSALGGMTGIGNVGMGIPSMLLMPVWGPIALWITA